MNKIFTEDLSKTFITDGIKNSVLHDINFSISQGETCSIIGASGSGKSTFLHLLAKLDDYSSGRIFFNENQVNLLPAIAHLICLVFLPGSGYTGSTQCV